MPIFDQGYQHWQGKLAGHGWRWLAITRHGVRVGMQNKFLRLLLLGSLIPALLLAGVIALWGMVEQKSAWAVSLLGGIDGLRDLIDDPTPYRLTAWTLCFHFFLDTELYIIMLLVLLVGPSLISQDLRFNALPLYFSRPVRRIDYFLGKLGVIGFFLALVAIVPATLAWILGLLFSLDFSAILTTFRLLMGMVLTGLVITVSAGLFILALSALSRNSRYVAICWASVWFLTTGVSAMLVDLHRQSFHRDGGNLQWEQVRKRQDLNKLEQQLPFDPFPNEDKPFVADPQKPTPAELQKLQNWEEQNQRNQQQRQAHRKNLEQRISQHKDDLENMKKELEIRQQQAEVALREDWRPLISYHKNLLRIGFALIGSQEAWENVDRLLATIGRRQRGFNPNMIDGRPGRTSSLAASRVPQYPWYWSAFVLLALGGVSVWILNKRVTSLDQLR
jgi:ABC-2 type transport system permease protein